MFLQPFDPQECKVPYLKDLIDISHPVKIDLNKKLFPKQKTFQAFNINA